MFYVDDDKGLRLYNSELCIAGKSTNHNCVLIVKRAKFYGLLADKERPVPMPMRID